MGEEEGGGGAGAGMGVGEAVGLMLGPTLGSLNSSRTRRRETAGKDIGRGRVE